MYLTVWSVWYGDLTCWQSLTPWNPPQILLCQVGLFLSLFLSHCSKDLEWWTIYSSNRQSFIKQAAGRILNNRLVSALLHLSYNLNRQKAVGSALLRLECGLTLERVPHPPWLLFLYFLSLPPEDWLIQFYVKQGLCPPPKWAYAQGQLRKWTCFLAEVLTLVLDLLFHGLLFVCLLSTWFCCLRLLFLF